MPRHKFPKGNKFASKEHKELVALTKTPEERQASKTLLNPTTTYMTIFYVDVRGKSYNFLFESPEPRKSGS